jgi:hypothetical protein
MGGSDRAHDVKATENATIENTETPAVVPDTKAPVPAPSSVALVKWQIAEKKCGADGKTPHFLVQ